MSNSNLKFRKLTLEDIPDIQNLSKDIWMGHDYIPNVIENWIKNPQCYAFGAFINSKIVGLANVRHLTPEIVWFEGGRVLPGLQSKGIGVELFNQCLKHAEETGVKYAQFDTSSENIRSIALGRRFGFKKKEEMPAFSAFIENNKIINVKVKEVKEIDEISSDKALNFAKIIPNGPKDEICLGWYYIPFSKEFITESLGKWFKFGKALILVIDSTRKSSAEVPEEGQLWIIAYGDSESISKLLQGYFYKLEKKGVTRSLSCIDVICHLSLFKTMEELGFKRLKFEISNEEISVLLFEKNLKEEK